MAPASAGAQKLSAIKLNRLLKEHGVDAHKSVHRRLWDAFRGGLVTREQFDASRSQTFLPGDADYLEVLLEEAGIVYEPLPHKDAMQYRGFLLWRAECITQQQYESVREPFKAVKVTSAALKAVAVVCGLGGKEEGDKPVAEMVLQELVELVEDTGFLSEEQIETLGFSEFRGHKCYLHSLIPGNEPLQKLIERYVLAYSQGFRRLTLVVNLLLCSWMDRVEAGDGSWADAFMLPMRLSFLCELVAPTASPSDDYAKYVAPVLAESADVLPPNDFEGSALLRGQALSWLAKQFSQAFNGHVRTHMLTRLQAYALDQLRRHADISFKNLEETVPDGNGATATKKYRHILCDGVDEGRLYILKAQMFVKDGMETYSQRLQDIVKGIQRKVRAGEAWYKTPRSMSGELVHTHIRLSRIVEAQYRADKAAAEAGPQPAPRVKPACTMYAAAPIANGSRMHATIDDRVLADLLEVPRGKSPGLLAKRVDLKAYRQAKVEMRSQLRKQAKKGRKQPRQCGVGRLPRDARLKSIVTDGVSAFIRCAVRKAPQCVTVTEAWREKKRGVGDGIAADWWAAHADKQPRVLAIDPGRANLYHGVCPTFEDGITATAFFDAHVAGASPVRPADWNERRLTRPDYNGRSLIKKQRKWAAKQVAANAGLREAQERLSSETFKTSNTETFVSTLRVDKEVRPTIWAEHSRVEYAKWRMLLFRRKRETLTQAIRSAVLVDGKVPDAPLVVAVGSASMAPTGKGEQAVPVKEWVRVLRWVLQNLRVRRGKRTSGLPNTLETLLFGVWEHNTTAKCFGCHHANDKVYKFDDNGATQEDRRLRTCSHCPVSADQQAPKRLNRDGNAAKNIWMASMAVLQRRPRPAYLCPLTAEERAERARAAMKKRCRKVPLNSAPPT